MNFPMQIRVALVQCALLLHAACVMAAPKIEVESATLDFGRIGTFAPSERELHVKNVGDSPLRIERVALTPPLRITRMPATLAPGAEASLLVAMNPASRTGRFEGNIIIFTDDPGQPEAALAVTATIVPPIEIAPRPQFFLAGVRGDAASASLDIVNHAAQPLHLEPPRHSSERFTSHLDTIEDGERYRLTITLNSDAPAGRHTEPITLATTSAALPVITIPANTWLRERVHTFPDAVDLGAFHVADLRRDPRLFARNAQTLMVYQAHGHAFEIGVATDVPGLRLSATRGPDGDRYQITLSLDPDSAMRPKSIRGQATITTNDSAFPRIVVPITGEIVP